MNSNYKVKLGVEPTNSYEKARNDLITAFNSIKQLTHEQQRHLAVEVLGLGLVTDFENIMQSYYANH